MRQDESAWGACMIIIRAQSCAIVIRAQLPCTCLQTHTLHLLHAHARAQGQALDLSLSLTLANGSFLCGGGLGGRGGLYVGGRGVVCRLTEEN